VTVAAEIAALQVAPTKVLVARYVELFGKEPRFRHPRWVFKRVAWKIQEQAYGGLSPEAQARLDELIEEVRPQLVGDAPPPSRTRPRPGTPAVGTTIVREWHGEAYHVRVVDGGYELSGVVFKSASALARHVTGQRWNGRLWLGLTGRKKRG
jgi:hypothetical protein